MADLRLERPEAGKKIFLNSSENDNIIFDFPVDEAVMSREEGSDELVFSFDDGSSIVILDFYDIYTSENMPDFVIEDQVIDGATFFASFDESLMPAAGPATGEVARNNETINYDADSIGGGIGGLGAVDTNAHSRDVGSTFSSPTSPIVANNEDTTSVAPLIVPVAPPIAPVAPPVLVDNSHTQLISNDDSKFISEDIGLRLHRGNSNSQDKKIIGKDKIEYSKDGTMGQAGDNDGFVMSSVKVDLNAVEQDSGNAVTSSGTFLNYVNGYIQAGNRARSSDDAVAGIKFELKDDLLSNSIDLRLHGFSGGEEVTIYFYEDNALVGSQDIKVIKEILRPGTENLIAQQGGTYACGESFDSVVIVPAKGTSFGVREFNFNAPLQSFEGKIDLDYQAKSSGVAIDSIAFAYIDGSVINSNLGKITVKVEGDGSTIKGYDVSGNKLLFIATLDDVGSWTFDRFQEFTNKDGSTFELDFIVTNANNGVNNISSTMTKDINFDDTFGVGAINGAYKAFADSNNYATAADARDFEVIGNEQNNILLGKSGNDTLKGGAGDDQLFGEAGNDLIEGGSGDDLLGGSAGNDLLKGGTGVDKLYGGTGNDRLFGEEDDDIIFGEDGNDYIEGGAGNDYIDGGTGVDILYGGKGNDLIRFDADDTVVDGGENFDIAIGGILGESETMEDMLKNLKDIEMLITGEGTTSLTDIGDLAKVGVTVSDEGKVTLDKSAGKWSIDEDEVHTVKSVDYVEATYGTGDEAITALVQKNLLENFSG